MSASEGPPPIFFLSYSRIDSRSAAISRNLDTAVVEFFETLCEHLWNLTDHSGPNLPGYLDRTMGLGTRWEGELWGALATCQVFVPLYSPRYFESEWCGREWDAFRRRQEADGLRGTTRTAIVPVLWTDRADLRLPACATEVLYYSLVIDDHYERHGVYGLMMEDPPRYRQVAYRIAKAIRDAAVSTRLRACDTALFTDLRNAFEDTP